MTIIAQLNIPQMYTAYAQDLKYLDNGLHHYQYFCEECDQIFSSAWGRIPGAISWYERGSYFYCPNCRQPHEKNVAYVKETAPNKMRLVIKEYEKVVTFEIHSKNVIFSRYLSLDERQYKEIFRFDIAKQRVSLSIYEWGELKETIELGNPFKYELFEKSILHAFMPNSLPNTNQKKELNNILKTLRETIHRKLEKRVGYKISSMFVSPGSVHGTFLLPILNIAYRVTCPDAPNLPKIYREDHGLINEFFEDKKMIQKFDFMPLVMAQTRRKTPFVTALINTTRLPDKPFIRRALTEDPFMAIILKESFKLCQNYDNAIQMYDALRNLNQNQITSPKDLIRFLRVIKPMYGESGIIRLVSEAQELNTRDCIRLYKYLNGENKRALRAERVRLRDLHDWMSLRHKKQTHENIPFSVPDHVVKRLSMQKNRLSFFLPKESMELLEAGHTLHNCVASYGKAMKDNQKWIVLVSDDKGKLVACLEIQGKELYQAKLDKNQAVFMDKELNNAILDWAKKAKIQIKTSDVRVPKEEKKSVPA